MAFVDTHQLPQDGKFKDVAAVVRALRGAAADELSAANLYGEMLACLKTAGQQYATVAERIEEIMEDEEMHLGSLLYCVEQLDKSIAENMQKGAAGE